MPASASFTFTTASDVTGVEFSIGISSQLNLIMLLFRFQLPLHLCLMLVGHRRVMVMVTVMAMVTLVVMVTLECRRRAD